MIIMIIIGVSLNKCARVICYGDKNIKTFCCLSLCLITLKWSDEMKKKNVASVCPLLQYLGIFQSDANNHTGVHQALVHGSFHYLKGIYVNCQLRIYYPVCFFAICFLIQTSTIHRTAG